MGLSQDAYDKIMTRINDYNAQVRKIEGDPELSDLGKRRKLQPLHEATHKAVEQMKASSEASNYSRKKELERQLFGVGRNAEPSALISLRDAQDRVAQVKDPEKLGELMERAAGVGDDVLLRAAFQHALTQTRNPMASDRWDHLVNEYLTQTPGADAALAEYREVSGPGAARDLFARAALAVRQPELLQKPEGLVTDVPPQNPQNLQYASPMPAGLQLVDPNPAA